MRSHRRRYGTDASPISLLIAVFLSVGAYGCFEDSVGAGGQPTTPNGEPSNLDEPGPGEDVPIVGIRPALGPLDVASPGVDAAVWVHPTDPSRSLCFLATGAGSIYAYDLEGDLLQVVDLGADPPGGAPGQVLSGIDVRTGFRYRASSIDVLAGNLRQHGKLALLRIDPDATGRGDVLTVLVDRRGRQNDLSADSGAFTLYRRPSDGSLYAIDQPRSGDITPRQYLITEANGEIVTRQVRVFDDHRWSSGAGFVADDAVGFLYLGEETVGVNKYEADPGSGLPGRLAVLAVDDGIRGKREGLALYSCDDGAGYVILATEDAEPNSGRHTTSSRFMVYERQAANRKRKEFLALDSIHTNGFAVSGSALPGFPAGLALLQVDAGSGRQFFAYDWRDIAEDDLPSCR